MKKVILFVLVLALGFGGAYYMVKSKPKPKKKAAQAVIPLVVATEFEPSAVTLTVASRGLVEARTKGSIIPEVGGQIIDVSDQFVSGGEFKQGDILLRIDPRDYQADVTIAEADLAQAKVQLSEEQARSDQALKNWRRLGNRGEPNALTLRKPQLARAEASVAASSARLQRAKLALERTSLKAPYDGVVLNKLADIGQVISRGSPVAEIMASDRAEIRLPVTAEALEALPAFDPQTPLQVRLTIDTQKPHWNATIIRQAGRVDAQTRQIILIAEVDQPLNKDKHGAPLRIGQYVNAAITGINLPQAYRLPRSAIVNNQHIYHLGSQNKLKALAADILWQQQDDVIVADNFSANGMPALSVITNPPAYAYDGMQVKTASSEKTATESQP